MRIPFALSSAILVAACFPTPGKAPEVTAVPGTPEYLEQQETVCEARGGDFRPGPGKTTLVCYETPKDANQPCASKTDCDGVCLARSRTCAPVKPLFGCHEVLLDSGMPATVCLD